MIDDEILLSTDEGLTASFIQEQLAEYADFIENQSKAGKMSALARKKQRASTVVNQCSTVVNQSQLESKSQIQVKSKKEEMPAALSSSPEFLKAWQEWKTYKTEKLKKLTPSTIAKQLKTLEAMGPDKATQSIDRSIANGWIGLFEPKSDESNAPAQEYDPNEPI